MNIGRYNILILKYKFILNYISVLKMAILILFVTKKH